MRDTKQRNFRRAATIQDVAEAVGVTKTTVSKVFNGKGSISPATAEAIRGAARRLNFEHNPHARRLSQGGDDNTVSIFSPYLDFYSGARKLRIIQQSLVEKGYDIPAYTYAMAGPAQMAKQAVASMNMLRRQRPRAIIYGTHGLNVPELRDAMQDELSRYIADGGLLVCHDREMPLACDQVTFDRRANIYLVTDHLVRLGHRRIGYCESDGGPHHGGRFAGYCQALAEHGIELSPQWLFTAERDGVNQDEPEAIGAEVARQFLSLNDRPTAICIADDYAAAACIAELQRSGLRVPHDVSIAGDDDAPIARYGAVRLTTASHPVDSIAHSVIGLLESRLSGEYTGPPRRVEVAGELRVRESTGAPQ